MATTVTARLASATTPTRSTVCAIPIRRASATGKFSYAANGHPVRMLGVAVDITEIYEVEEKLREYQEQLKGIVEAAMDAIISVDDEQRIRVFNAAAERMFRCRASDAIGAPLEQFVPERHEP